MKDLAAWVTREKIATWMAVRGYATGHGDTIDDLLVELEGQAKERGRNDERRASAPQA
jgi:hypothetical protein